MNTPSALLDAIVKALIGQKGDLLITPWFSEAKAHSIDKDVLTISVPTPLVRDTLLQHFTEDVADACLSLTGREIRPLFLTDVEVEERNRQESSCIYSSYTFERFIVGNSNKFAHAAAVAVANYPAVRYNPLFIYGQSGLGKTHLLYAIAGHLRKTHPHFNIVYIKGDDFTNELVDAIQNRSVADFRQVYRKADLLLVDDVQFIAGKEQTQEEFFHTFNVLYETAKQVVLTSDRPPKEIHLLVDRLRTRFEAGLLADIQSPDLETRMALVTKKSELMGVILPQNIVEYVASSITNNVRELEGAVKKIIARHSLMGTAITREMAEEAIQDIFKEKPGLNPTPELILQEVADFYNITPDRIRGNSRTREVVLPRQVTAYLIRELTDNSLPDIGSFLGQHHTTVIHSINKLESKMKEEERLYGEVKDLKSNIQNA